MKTGYLNVVRVRELVTYPSFTPAECGLFDVQANPSVFPMDLQATQRINTEALKTFENTAEQQQYITCSCWLVSFATKLITIQIANTI